MKNKITILGILAAVTLLFSTCDYVQYKAAPAVPFTFKTGVVYRKVLIEDYTGHKCGNCPRAAETLTTMEANTTFGTQFVPIAVHAGFYAVVSPPTFPTNLQSTQGTTYDNTFGISLAGNPNGLINRTGFGTPTFIKAYTSWGGYAASMDSTAADFQIIIDNFYISSSNQLTAKITASTTKALTGTYNLVVVLTEDSIVGPQEDYSLPPSNQVIPNYVFNHVLRDAINSTWGDNIYSGTITKGQTVNKTYNYTVSTNYKAQHCHIIAYIYDAASSSPTYYEIRQVETATLF